MKSHRPLNYHPEEEPEWRKAGWSQEPRNGREWKLLKSGGKEPTKQGSRGKPCRVCKGRNFDLRSHLYKGERRMYRTCLDCRSRTMKRFAERNPEKIQEWQGRYKRTLKAPVEQNPDGPTEISSRWYHHNTAEVHQRIAEGESFLVNYFGSPLYVMVPIEEYTREEQRDG